MHAFAEVAVGLPVWGTYHYRVPPPLVEAAQVGTRVLVPFGGRGVTGVIVRCGAPPDELRDVRDIREVLDARPALDATLIDLCLWVAEYYEAPPGEVLRAALPAGTQVASRPKLVLTERGRRAIAGEAASALPPTVMRALARVARGRAGDPAGLVAAGLVELSEGRRAPRVKVRTVGTVRLVRPATEDEQRAMRRAPRRLQLLAALDAAGGALDARDLAAKVPGAAAAIKALVEAGVCERGRRESVRDPWVLEGASAPSQPLSPTPGQQAALATLAEAIDARRFQAFLLHGVTGSGKTEVYLQAIARVLAAGRSALVLVPEIALTPQLAARFRARFGDLVAVLHSGLSDGERYDQWRRLRAGQARIALGARSAVFAPVSDVGILVVDEEHDPSFKQEEGVRYHARDVALVRAQRAGALCVLGSATPSLESYANASAGRFTLLELPARATTRPLPDIQVVNMRVYRPDGEGMLTAPLAAAIEAALAAGEQTVLFLNRRGFATFVLCTDCGRSFRCPHCSVSLTYHRAGERLRCHYCGYAEHVPIQCPGCQGSGIRRLGLGTERVEAAVRARFPAARVARLDRDTASGTGLRDLLARVASRDIDVLVGTQMVTKGHDFPGVTLVGVLCADSGLSLPDFRASERTFQLLTQVAGRAGRGDRPGRVIVQTWNPDHPAVVHASSHDYRAFYAAEMLAREELAFPPHGRLVTVRLDGEDETLVRGVADELGARAKSIAGAIRGVDVRGPAPAPLQRLKGRCRWHLLLGAKERHALRRFVRGLVSDERRPPGVRVTVDVDPMSAL